MHADAGCFNIFGPHKATYIYTHKRYKGIDWIKQLVVCKYKSPLFFCNPHSFLKCTTLSAAYKAGVDKEDLDAYDHDSASDSDVEVTEEVVGKDIPNPEGANVPCVGVVPANGPSASPVHDAAATVEVPKDLESGEVPAAAPASENKEVPAEVPSVSQGSGHAKENLPAVGGGHLDVLYIKTL